jgi:hypothetical protein
VNPTQEQILIYSRIVGWLLCGTVLASLAFTVMDFRHVVFSKRGADLVRTETFVEKVRACRRAAPKPAPSWAVCERRVRETE